MTSRSFTWNAYESTLLSDFISGSTTAVVDSALGLVAPVYLVVDPDVPASREWIKVGAINGNTLENIDRDLDGSVGDITHAAGAKVRTIFTKQLQDDIFNDIDTNVADLSQHEVDDADPHQAAEYAKLSVTDTLYLKLVGGGLSGTLAMNGNRIVTVAAPINPQDAANMDYVDNAVDGINLSGYLLKAGGAMTGLLTLEDSVEGTALKAATQEYVTNAITGGGASVLRLDNTNNNAAPSNYLRQSDGDGRYLLIGANAVSASKWQTARTFTVALNGDVTGSVNQSVDGTGNPTFNMTATVVNDSHTHGNSYYTKTESNGRYLALAGGTMTGALNGVAGSVGSPGIRVGPAGYGMYQTGNYTGLTAGGSAVVVGNGSNEVYIDGITNGAGDDVQASGTQLVRVVSSRRYKDVGAVLDVEQMRNAIRALPVHEYQYKDQPGVEHVGWMAEDMASVDPRLVNFDEEGRPNSIRTLDVLAVLGV